MDEGIITAISAFLSFIGASGIISRLISRRIDKLEKKLDAREADRIEENLVRGEALIATGRLAEADALALRVLASDEVCERELAEHRRAHEKLEHFMRSKTAEYLHSN